MRKQRFREVTTMSRKHGGTRLQTQAVWLESPLSITGDGPTEANQHIRAEPMEVSGFQTFLIKDLPFTCASSGYFLKIYLT